MRTLLERVSRILVVGVLVIGALLALALIAGIVVYILTVAPGSHPH